MFSKLANVPALKIVINRGVLCELNKMSFRQIVTSRSEHKWVDGLFRPNRTVTVLRKRM